MAADFEQTYREYQQMVYAFLLRLCGNVHLAEELTQETFYQAFKHWDNFRGQSSASTWLCTIAKRQLYNALRRKEVLPIPEEMQSSTPDVADALDEANDFSNSSVNRRSFDFEEHANALWDRVDQLRKTVPEWQ